MSRAFNIPIFYKSDVVSIVKNYRRDTDRRKTDLTPSLLKLSKVTFKIARHFGFCFGVENAIEIAYRAISENPDKRVFLLSEMIHNPKVNGDLIQRGVRFLLSPKGEELVSFDLLTPDDIVIVPAFGTTVELFDRLKSKGIDPQVYNATCPFVERVWKRAAELGNKGFTIIIHGKHDHEETKATFSHARLTGPSVIIKDLNEAKELAEFITCKKPRSEFLKRFGNLCSEGFNPDTHLDKIGVVNQTTMLATETQTISDYLKEALCNHFGQDNLSLHYADTRDTLCYATKENQDAMAGLIEAGGDLAVIVGGYNSSNTSHLVELCEKKYPTYYIKDSSEIIDKNKIRHLNLHSNSVVESINWLPEKPNLEVMISAGASCPDALVDEVITKIAKILGVEQEIQQSVNSLG